MKVAVLIVNYNDEEDTIKYVTTIEKYDIINRIVVIDNLSTNEGTFNSLLKLESSKVKVIQSDKNGGYDYGNNFGFKYLEKNNENYDYIIISNPDIEVSQKAIAHSLEIIESDKKIAVIAPRMYNKYYKPIRRSSWKARTFFLDTVHATRSLEILFYIILRNGEYSKDDYSKEILEVEAISGAFFIIRSDVFKEIGMLDENVFLFYEEDILAKELMQRGYKTVSLNSEKFIHYESQTIGKSLSYYKKMQQLFESKMYYHKKYNNINRCQIIFYHLLNFCRKVELLFEIPIRKLLKK